MAPQEGLQVVERAPAARPAREVAHDHTPRDGTRALVVAGVAPVVADVRIGERDDLAGVARVGEDLLVARQRGVEHDFTGGDAVVGHVPDELALEHLAVGEHQLAVDAPGHRWAVPSITVGTPARTVWRTFPVSFTPSHGSLRLLLALRRASRTHCAAGSITQRFATSPARTGRPCRSEIPAIAAGCQLMRASTPCRSSARVTTSWVIATASAVSTPSIPGGASSNGCCFVSAACGAWSVAMASIVPSISAARTPSRSGAPRNGGFILNVVS